MLKLLTELQKSMNPIFYDEHKFIKKYIFQDVED